MNVALILNGPPGCGKDTMANIALQLGWVKRQFKDALYAKTAEYYKVGLENFIELASNRDTKDSVRPAGLFGKTPREALIHVSEDVFKPRHGSDYFGKVEADSVRKYFGRVGGDAFIVYPDGGFPDEVHAVGREFDLTIVVRLHRVGFDFSSDSRDYINLPDTEKCKSVDLYLTDGRVGQDFDDLMVVVENIFKTFKQDLK